MAPRLAKLVRWMERAEWSDLFQEWVDLHCGPAYADAGIDREGLADRIGEDGLMMVTECAFHDFFSVLGDDGLPFMEDYLKRRGFGESKGNQTYIRAVGASTMSLYEIVAVTPGESFEAADRLRDGPPIVVLDRHVSQGVEVGMVVGARPVRFMDRHELAGDLLVFEPEIAAAIVDGLRDILASPEQLTGEGEEDLEALRSPSDEPHFRSLAPLISNAWVSQELALSEAVGEDDGEEDD